MYEHVIIMIIMMDFIHTNSGKCPVHQSVGAISKEAFFNILCLSRLLFVLVGD